MKKKNWIPYFIFLFYLPVSSFALHISNLSCNYGHNPICIDDLHPRLSWQLESKKRGTLQSSYHVLVSSSLNNLENGLGDIWDSGKIQSDQSLFVKFNGRVLQSEKLYFWKVKVWDEEGKASTWSPVATWQMGLLNPSDWKARWISASKWFTAPEFRPKGLQLGPKGGWADIDLGRPETVDLIRLFPSDSSIFPARFQLLGSDEFNFVHRKVLIDQSQEDYKIDAVGAQEFRIHPVTYRFFRLEILANPKNENTTIRQIQIISGTKNFALMKFAREYGTDWDHGHAPFLVDGMPSQNDGKTCPVDACPSVVAPMFRKEFKVPYKIRSAVVYIAALGMADVSVNGKKVGNDVLGPPFTDYTKRIMYSAYDITNLIGQGNNVIGAVLGNGFFSTPSLGFGQRQNGNGPPRLLIQVKITYADGRRKIIATDSTWKWSRSEIVFNDVWDGYSEDRYQAKPGWNNIGYLDESWPNAVIMQALPGKLVARSGPSNRVNGIIKPISVAGNHAYFATASVGWPLLKVNGRAGQKITITGGGPGYQLAKLTFILAKDGPQTLSPRFVILPGPTDMKIDGLNGSLSPDDISIQYVNADLKEVSSFNCSNPFLNHLFEVTMHTHRDYINDFPADPNREKQGWTQDAENMFNTAVYFTDVRDLYQRWWNDMADSQDEQGYLGSVVPMVNRQVYDWNSPWWSGMIVFLPWEHYQYYGNIKLLEEGYDGMRKYVDLLGRIAKTGEGKNWDDYTYFTKNLDTSAARDQMIIWNGAGDWNNPYTRTQHAVPTPMTTMPAWYHFAQIVSKTAGLLGKKQDEFKYATIAEGVKNRFNQKYYNPQTGLYGDSTNSQTGQVMPLAVGMVPDHKENLTYQRLIDAIHLRNDHVGTGFISINYMLQILASHRESVIANKMINQRDYPGWNTLTKGGVLQEEWNGGGAQMPSCGGAVGAWLFQSVLGIQPDSKKPGFKQFIISPQPDVATNLISAKGYYDSGYGRISIDWKCHNGYFEIDVEIPANTMATLIIPAENEYTIKESGQLVQKGNQIQLLSFDHKLATYLLKSGIYHFETNYNF